MLEVIRREGVLVAERDGGEGAVRVYGVMFRGEREERDDNHGHVGGEYFYHEQFARLSTPV